MKTKYFCHFFQALFLGLGLALLTTAPANAAMWLGPITLNPAQPTTADQISLKITGSLPTPCYTVYPPTVSRSGNTITVNINAVPNALICVQIIGFFDITANLGTLPSGDYSYTVRLFINGTLTDPVTNSFTVLPTLTANPLPQGTLLSLEQGVGSAPNTPCATGSCFGAEVAPSFVAWADLKPGTDGGIIIGKNQTSGGQEKAPSSSNTTSGQLTAAWLFFGNYGTFATAPLGGQALTDASLNIFDNASCAGASCLGKTNVGTWNMAWNGGALNFGSAVSCPLPQCSPEQQAGIFINTWQVNTDRSYLLDFSNVAPSGQIQGIRFRFLLRGQVIPSPTTVSGFWPATTTPGSFVFVFGSNFALGQNTQVSVNGINAPLVLVIDPTVLIFSLPSGNTAGPITVTTPSNSATSTTSFGVPINGVAITGFWPSQGPVGGVGFVFGGGFVPLGTQVAVNGVFTPIVQVLDSGLALFVIPPGATTGPVSVKTTAGQATSAAPFVVVP